MFDIEKANEVEREIEGEAILEDSLEVDLDDVIKPLPFTWGIEEIDKKIGAFDYNRLIIVPGEAGSGKTTYTIQMAQENARNGLKVAYMSLEMGAKGLIVATAKKAAGIEMQTKAGQAVSVSEKQREIFRETVAELSGFKNLDIIGYKKSLTLKSFEKELERLAADYDLIYIDNLGFIGRTDGRKESELTPLITELCMNARKDYKVSIIALTHMTKGSEKQEGPRGRSAIRGSGKVIDDADKIVQIFRQGDETSFILQKDRDNGLNAIIPLIFDKGKFSVDCFDL